MSQYTERYSLRLASFLNTLCENIRNSNDQSIPLDSFKQNIKYISSLQQKSVSQQLSYSIKRLFQLLNYHAVEEQQLFSLCLKLLIYIESHTNNSKVWLNLNNSIDFLDEIANDSIASDLIKKSLSSDVDNWRATRMLVLLVKKSKNYKLRIVRYCSKRLHDIGFTILKNENFSNINYLIELISILFPSKEKNMWGLDPTVCCLWSDPKFDSLHEKFPFAEAGELSIFQYLNEVATINQGGASNFTNLYQLDSIECKTASGYTLKDSLLLLQILGSDLVLWKPDSEESLKLIPSELNLQHLKHINVVKRSHLRLAFSATTDSTEFALLSENTKIRNIVLEFRLTKLTLGTKLMQALKKFTDPFHGKRKISTVQNILSLNTSYDSYENDIPVSFTLAQKREETGIANSSINDDNPAFGIEEHNSLLGLVQHPDMSKTPQKISGKINTEVGSHNSDDNEIKKTKVILTANSIIDNLPQMQVPCSSGEDNVVQNPKSTSDLSNSFSFEMNPTDIVTSTATKLANTKKYDFDNMDSCNKLRDLNRRGQDTLIPGKSDQNIEHDDIAADYINNIKEPNTRSSSILSGIEKILVPSSIQNNEKEKDVAPNKSQKAISNVLSPKTALRKLNQAQKSYGKGKSKFQSSKKLKDIWDFSSPSPNASPVGSPMKFGTSNNQPQKENLKTDEVATKSLETKSSGEISVPFVVEAPKRKRGRPPKGKNKSIRNGGLKSFSDSNEKLAEDRSTICEKDISKQEKSHANIGSSNKCSLRDNSISQLSEIPDSQFHASILLDVNSSMAKKQSNGSVVKPPKYYVTPSKLGNLSDAESNIATQSSPIINAKKRAIIKSNTTGKRGINNKDANTDAFKMPVPGQHIKPDVSNHKRVGSSANSRSSNSPKANNALKYGERTTEKNSASNVDPKHFADQRKGNVEDSEILERRTTSKRKNSPIRCETEDHQIHKKSKLEKTSPEISEALIHGRDEASIHEIGQYGQNQYSNTLDSDDIFTRLHDVENNKSITGDTNTARTSFISQHNSDSSFSVNFYKSMSEGLNLMSMNLVNSMRQVECHMKQMERDLREDLENKLKEVHDFHSQRIQDYLNQVKNLDGKVLPMSGDL